MYLPSFETSPLSFTKSATAITIGFPEGGRVSGSRSLVASDAFGISGFNQVFTAQYQRNGAGIMAYVARRESAAAAQSTAETVRDFYLEYGGTSLDGPEGAAVIDILDTIEVVLHQGRYVIGVHEAPDRATDFPGSHSSVPCAPMWTNASARTAWRSHR